ncbi:uncharacterized protein LOC131315557 isoform X2 [Rhododendron vialii]|uniref:uncharacterized protein LOC131315557 isoform X2 n=1 Tax=Rhododendron vialii TaxID=182163 RepID=UPI00265D660E|nr:uncharacterized protein LOC131315557 isoform X2 [Rhododendron vialii]
MSSRSGNGGGGEQSIPAASSKMVQSLKEIVNCPESEIYAMLKECNMDPNEAVNRLLSQDPFHEVKSKREKKKENKDTTESWPRGVSNSSNRVGRGSSDRYTGRGGSAQFSSSESGALHGKLAYKKENGTHNYSTPLSVSFGMTGHNLNQRPPAQSDPAARENKATTIGTVNGALSSSQPPGYHAAWSGVPGQVSMADIVKMGRSHYKASSGANPSQYGVNQHHVQTSRSSEDNVSKVLELNHELVVGTGLHVSSNDDWPLVEQPLAVRVPPVLEQPVASDLHVDASNFSPDITKQHPQSPKDEFREPEDEAIESINTYCAGSASAATHKMLEDNPSGDFLFSGMYENMASYQTHRSGFEHQEAEDVGALVSMVMSNLHQLSVHEVRGAPPEEDNPPPPPPPPVIIPSHLQVQTADCSHLSFGSFGSGIGGSAFSRPFSSRPLQSNMEESSADADASSVGHPDTRNPEYHIDESLRAASDGNLVHRTGATAGRSDSLSSSPPEVLKQENTEAPHENQYSFQSSTSSYNFENGQQLSSQMRNLAPFSSVMAYTNTLPSSLLAASGQPVRESDLQYSPFPTTHTMPTKYGNAVSSISSSTISIPEALKTSGIFSTQPTAQTLTRSNIGTGPALPQHLAVHPYSQSTVPLGPFANMIGYPFLPQSYTYMPSAFQQAFAGNSAYHQSLAAVLPQYKNVSVGNLPQSAAIASGYGGFGSSTSIPGNFLMNTSTSSGPTTISYDDLMASQYKDSNHLISLQQNENSPMWVHGAGSRTLSPVPSSTYYSYQGQSQQQPPSGYRHTQQPSQNYAGLGYPNFYHSQTGMSLEHQQQQNPRDVHLASSQAQVSKQSQQLWQNSY